MRETERITNLNSYFTKWSIVQKHNFKPVNEDGRFDDLRLNTNI